MPMGLTLGQIINDIGGGVPNGKKLKMLQTGWASWWSAGRGQLGRTHRLRLRCARPARFSAQGGIIVIDEDTCAVDITRNLVAFTQYESCGKCFPCRLGMEHLLEVVDRIVRFESRLEDLDLFAEHWQDDGVEFAMRARAVGLWAYTLGIAALRV